jgi:hypothetical protein
MKDIRPTVPGFSFTSGVVRSRAMKLLAVLVCALGAAASASAQEPFAAGPAGGYVG